MSKKRKLIVHGSIIGKKATLIYANRFFRDDLEEKVEKKLLPEKRSSLVIVSAYITENFESFVKFDKCTVKAYDSLKKKINKDDFKVVNEEDV